MKFIKLLVVTAFLFLASPLNLLAATPKPTQKPLEVNSFEMFWPLVAGKVQGDSLYELKSFKEKVRGFFIFSNLKKAEYSALLSQKRLLEYEKLAVTDKNLDAAKTTLEVLKKTQELSVSQLKKAKEEGMDVSTSTQTIMAMFDKEHTLLQSLLSKVDESQKGQLSEVITNLATLTSGL